MNQKGEFMDEVNGAMESVKVGLSLLSDAIGLAKKTKDALPNSKDKDLIDKGLNEAEKASKLAEAQIAQALGYNLCKCTFPPQIMLSAGYKENIEDFRCPKCSKSSIAPKKVVSRPQTIKPMGPR
ncbi:hypothetical protein [Microbulbifer sp. DLAB2-AA]|uniref:hypothetical protein n=2 Tax=Microbulbifer TaxID=48073 RepID=UPI004039CACF